MPKIKDAKTFLDLISDEFGDDIVVKDEANDVIEVISTGALSLDISTGIGGIPRGKFTEIFGPEGSGKTTLALSVTKQALIKYPELKVLYVDVENQLDLNYARALVENLDTSRFIIVQPETTEQAFQLIEKATVTQEFSMIILDSVGALSPEKEKEDEFTDSNVALTARAMTKFLRRDAFAIRTNNIAFVLINQVRDKIGAFMPTFETPGGHALKHYASIRIQLSVIDKIKKGDNIFGIQTKFVTKKNKLSAPLKEALFPIIFGKGIDTYRDAIQFSQKLGVTKKRGDLLIFEDVELGKGVTEATAYLQANPELLDKMAKVCYTIVKDQTPKGEE